MKYSPKKVEIEAFQLEESPEVGVLVGDYVIYKVDDKALMPSPDEDDSTMQGLHIPRLVFEALYVEAPSKNGKKS